MHYRGWDWGENQAEGLAVEQLAWSLHGNKRRLLSCR